MARVGKTHLAINLTLEYVRRGRLAGLYHELDLASPIDEVLALRAPEPRQQGAGEDQERIMRRAFQGMDILSCGNPLPCRTAVLPDTLARDFARLEIQNTYDDFLIDTSGMGPHTVLACCLAAPLVALLVTPDAASQAETFALLKVLQMNGFEGRLGLVINRLQHGADAGEIHRKFSGTVQQYLGLAVPLLGAMVNDEHVPIAQRAGQAVTSFFPEAEISACIQAIAHNADERQPLAQVTGRTVSGFWDAFVDAAALAMYLPGGVLLEPQECADLESLQGPSEPEGDAQTAMALLQFEGELDELYTTLLNLPVPLRTLADDMLELRDGIKAAEADILPAAIAGSLKDGRLQRVAVLLIRAVEPGEADLHHVQLQVSERIIPGKDGDWLQAGRYLNYEFRLLDQGEAAARMLALAPALPDARQDTGPAGESIRTWFTPARDGCLNVILSPAEGVRVQVWTAADRRRSSLPAPARSGGQSGTLTRPEGKTLH